MKILIMSLFALMIAFTGSISHADPDGGFPMKSVLMPFPWNNISGVWKINDPTLGSVFSFDVKKTESGDKVLQVLEIDEKTGVVKAKGAGVAIPGDKNTVSVMMAGDGIEPYMLYVRHVREKRYSRRQATLVTIKSLNGSGQPAASPEHNYTLNRLSDEPYTSQESYFERDRY